jgi:hypothetical protein
MGVPRELEMTERLQRAFKSQNYDRQGEFLLSLSADDYIVVIHALIVAGYAFEEKSVAKGTPIRDRSCAYDELHDQLMDWNHCDIEPNEKEQP